MALSWQTPADVAGFLVEAERLAALRAWLPAKDMTGDCLIGNSWRQPYRR